MNDNSGADHLVERAKLKHSNLLSLGSRVTDLLNNRKLLSGITRLSSEQPITLHSELFRKLWPQVSSFALMDEFRAASILSCLERSLAFEGDLIECGVYKGGISVLLALALREYGSSKKLYLLDSFKGLPTPNPKFDSVYEQGAMRSSRKELVATLTHNKIIDHCVVIEGWFSDSLKQLPSELQLCLIHLDCDLYDSAKECLNRLYPRLQPNASLVVDDYYDGTGGMQIAIDQHVRSTKEIVHLGPPPQAILIKGLTCEEKAWHTFRADGCDAPFYSVDLLQRQQVFLRALADAEDAVNTLSAEFTAFSSILTGPRSATVNMKSEVFPLLFE